MQYGYSHFSLCTVSYNLSLEVVWLVEVGTLVRDDGSEGVEPSYTELTTQEGQLYCIPLPSRWEDSINW